MKLHPANVLDVLKPHVLVCDDSLVVDLERSEGSYVVDAKTGKRYLDCFSQYASQPLGWNHPRLLAAGDAMKAAAYHKVANPDVLTTQYGEFVEAFAEVAGQFKHFFFIDGGTLAVENALKAAFDWKAKKLGMTDSAANNLDVIHFEQAFHGRSGYTLSLTNTTKDKTEFFPKFPWTRVRNPKMMFPTDDAAVAGAEVVTLSQIEKAFKERPVAAIILETIQGEGGDNQFSRNFFQSLRKLANEYEAMLILDEVQTGLGMTGRMWGYQHYGIVPDMICFGKKTQVCGFASTGRIDEVENNVFRQKSRINSTWGGNIVDMVRAKAIIDTIKSEGLVERASHVGATFLSQLRYLDRNVTKNASSPITNVRGKGLMIAFDLESAEQRNQLMAEIGKTMLVIKCGERSIRLRPALTFDNADALLGVDTIRNAARSVLGMK